MYAMRDSGMTYAEISSAIKRDTSTIQSTCAKLSKLVKQNWFVEMLDKIGVVAREIKSGQEKRAAIDAAYFNAPLRLYMNAFSMAD
jgi:hypothetical protein